MRGQVVSDSDPVSEATAASEYRKGNYQPGPTTFLTASEINAYRPSKRNPYPLPKFTVSSGSSYSSSWQLGFGVYGTFTYGQTLASSNTIGFMVTGEVVAKLPHHYNLFVWMPKVQDGNPLEYHVYVGTFGPP